MLTIILNTRVLYLESLRDYETCQSIGVPLIKISRNFLPLLKERAKRNKVRVKIVNFADVEQGVFDKITKRWEHTFEVTPNRILIESPRKKSQILRSKILLDKLRDFYQSNMFDLTVKERRYPSKFHISIERSFNDQKNPEWKEQADS